MSSAHITCHPPVWGRACDWQGSSEPPGAGEGQVLPGRRQAAPVTDAEGSGLQSTVTELFMTLENA